MSVQDGEWRSASSSGSDGTCVEVRASALDVCVRNSKDRDGPVLRFTHAEWRAFLAGARGGRVRPRRRRFRLRPPTTLRPSTARSQPALRFAAHGGGMTVLGVLATLGTVLAVLLLVVMAAVPLLE